MFKYERGRVETNLEEVAVSYTHESYRRECTFKPDFVLGGSRSFSLKILSTLVNFPSTFGEPHFLLFIIEENVRDTGNT